MGGRGSRNPTEKHAPPSRAGMTLLEMTLSVALLSIILGSIGSLVVVSSRVLPDSSSPVDGDRRAAAAMESLRADLATAASIVSGGDRFIEFTVPDRDADTKAETLRIEWAGNVGDPLTRTVNAGAAEVIAPGVQAFTITPTLAKVSRTEAGPAAEGSEAQLDWYTGSTNSVTNVSGTNRSAQTYRPALPADCTSWCPTKVDLYMARSAVSSPYRSAKIEVYALDAADLPTGLALASTGLGWSSVSTTAGWVEVSLGSVSARGVGAGVAVVIVPSSDWTAKMSTQSSEVADPDGQSAASSNLGVTWTGTSDGSLKFKLYGRLTRPTTVVVNENRVTALTVSLRVATQPRPLSGGVVLPAQPVSPLWIGAS